MRKTEFIKFRKIKTDYVVEKVVERDKFLALMTEIKNSFVNNNEISTKLVEEIPNTKLIEINDVRNRDCDTPFVLIYKDNGEKKVINIPRWHNIIWGILDEYSRV